jgi:hypothetical protein
MVLAVGRLDVREALGACTCQRSAAPEAGPSRPHRSRRDGGLGEHAATEQDGNLVRVDRVGCGFATMHGVHVQGMAEDQSDPMLSAEVRAPGPRSTGPLPQQREPHERAQEP